MLEVLIADNFRIPGVKHGFFTRKGGVSEGRYASLNNGLSNGDRLENVLENRRRVAVHLGVDGDHLLVCHQIHSPDVVTVTHVWERSLNPRADAMVTNIKGIALGVLTADCGPLLFADHGAGVIGAAHAGWRGALTGVIDNTLAAMERLGAQRSSTHVALGACIGKDSYEVGPEFPASFLAENPAYEKFFRPAVRARHYMFDLPGYIEAKVRGFGIASFSPSPADTFADEERFFSYRRDTLRGISPTPSLISGIAISP